MSKENIVLTEDEKKVIEKYFRFRMVMWWEYIISLDPNDKLSVEITELIKSGFLNGYAAGVGIQCLGKDKENNE